MQITLKKAVAAALVVGAAFAGAAAQAQIITTLPTVTGGSDLVLFATDTTSASFFAQDLGNSLDTIYSKAQVINDGVIPSGTNGSFNTPTSIGGTDAALAAFIASRPSGDNIEWTIFASDNTSSVATGKNLGASRGLITSQLDLTGTQSATLTNTNVTTLSSNVNTFFKNINTLYGSSNTNAVNGYDDGSITSDGLLSPKSWISASYSNGALLGQSQTMYLFATNGAGLSKQSNAYVGGTISISTAGLITVTNASAVPLPAAVWLLGSGLLGLVGIGRRRATA
jgi:hypothetical protein